MFDIFVNLILSLHQNMNVYLLVFLYFNTLWKCFIYHIIGAVMVVIIWQLDLQLPMQSVPITTKVVSLNPTHGKMYLRHYVIKFVSDLWQISDSLLVLLISPTNKTNRQDITEILLKVALSTTTLTPYIIILHMD